MSAVMIDGGIVHYEAFGRGTPILYIHGWLGSWRYWMQCMDSMAVEHRVYALDLWGFGDSDKAKKRFNRDDYLGLIDIFIQEMGIRKPVIVGHDLGAWIAIDYAVHYPDKIGKIMAVSLPLIADQIDRRLLTFQEGSSLAKLFRWWNPIPDKEIEHEAERTAESAIHLSLNAFRNVNFEYKIRHIACNVLIVCGEKDEVIDVNATRNIDNDGLENVKYIGLSGSKHFPMVDQGKKFNRLLKDFADKKATLESLQLKEEWRRRTR